MILSDTSLLSSFAAARALPLLLVVLEEDAIFIPPAVEQELQAGLAKGVTYLQSVLDLIPRGQVQFLCLNLASLLRKLWTEGIATRAKVKTMIVRMEKTESLVFRDRDRVFASQKDVPL